MTTVDSFQALPPLSILSSSALSFLDAKLGCAQDLAEAPAFVSELESECLELDRAVVNLNRSLESTIAIHASFSDRVHQLFSDISGRLIGLRSSFSPFCSVSDGGGLGEKLPELTKEVGRLEKVRAYADTTLKLDSLIGDIEDVVPSSMKNLIRHSSALDSEYKKLVAVKALKLTEDILTSVSKKHPDWVHLISAVDHRVDRALAIVRPQAIADHRSLLTSLGWPPPLSNFTSVSPQSRNSSQVLNPLFTVQGDLKRLYCESFLALCKLQELQRRRKSRQLEGHNREVALHQPLWAIEELVNPMSVACACHFSKWIDKPEFIFALVYKITRDFIDAMDELLQPLVDEAMLTGYSCREEWIAAMVSSLSMYLAKEIFPTYVSQPVEENVTGFPSQARTSWLHLIDLMVSFDKQIKSLVEQSGILLSLQEDGTLQKISSLSVFCDRPDWLDLWAEVELTDTLEKVNLEMDNEGNWTKKAEGSTLSGASDCMAPLISSIIIRHLSSLVERCQSLPAIPLRSRFLRLAATPIIRKFLDCLFFRCQEAEGLTALTNDDALIKVTNSINAARHIEAVLTEWSEDVLFLELGLDQNEQLGIPISISNSDAVAEGCGRGILEEETVKLEEFRKEWVEKISVVVLRGFDARSREYLRNRKQWLEDSEEGWTVSKTLVGALDYLQGKMVIVEGNLNAVDFTIAWRSLAAGVDKLIFNGILMSNLKFYNRGVERFDCDMGVLFDVFRSWCVRPEGFFPKVNEGLKLLKMGEEQLQDLANMGEIMLKRKGISHLTGAEAEKIAKNRVFMT